MGLHFAPRSVKVQQEYFKTSIWLKWLTKFSNESLCQSIYSACFCSHYKDCYIYIRACVHNNEELVRILTNKQTKQTKKQPNSHLLERQKRDVLPEVLCFVVTSNGLRGRTWIFMLERKLRSLSYWWWVHRDIREHVFCQDASFYTLLGKELTGGK